MRPDLRLLKHAQPLLVLSRFGGDITKRDPWHIRLIYWIFRVDDRKPRDVIEDLQRYDKTIKFRRYNPFTTITNQEGYNNEV